MSRPTHQGRCLPASTRAYAGSVAARPRKAAVTMSMNYESALKGRLVNVHKRDSFRATVCAHATYNYYKVNVIVSGWSEVQVVLGGASGGCDGGDTQRAEPAARDGRRGRGGVAVRLRCESELRGVRAAGGVQARARTIQVAVRWASRTGGRVAIGVELGLWRRVHQIHHGEPAAARAGEPAGASRRCA